jgi:hypothetical protein
LGLTAERTIPIEVDALHRPTFAPEETGMGDKGPGSKSKDKKKKGAKTGTKK